MIDTPKLLSQLATFSTPEWMESFPYRKIIQVDGPDRVGKTLFIERLTDWFNNNVFANSDQKVKAIPFDYNRYQFICDNWLDAVNIHTQWLNELFAPAVECSADPSVAFVLSEGWSFSIRARLFELQTSPIVRVFGQWLSRLPVMVTPMSSVLLTADIVDLETRATVHAAGALQSCSRLYTEQYVEMLEPQQAISCDPFLLEKHGPWVMLNNTNIGLHSEAFEKRIEQTALLLAHAIGARYNEYAQNTEDGIVNKITRNATEFNRWSRFFQEHNIGYFIGDNQSRN